MMIKTHKMSMLKKAAISAGLVFGIQHFFNIQPRKALENWRNKKPTKFPVLRDNDPLPEDNDLEDDKNVSYHNMNNVYYGTLCGEAQHSRNFMHVMAERYPPS